MIERTEILWIKQWICDWVREWKWEKMNEGINKWLCESMNEQDIMNERMSISLSKI